jgi:hypothetical protein
MIIKSYSQAPLVPAKAGTQVLAKHWMPACAGMSGKVRGATQ